MDITTLAKLAQIQAELEVDVGDVATSVTAFDSEIQTVVQSEVGVAVGGINTAVTDLNLAAGSLSGPSQKLKEEVFTSNATWNWTNAGKPKAVWVTIYGSGGGGGNGQHSSGGGGGGSGYFVKDKYVQVTGDVYITLGNAIEEHNNGQTSSFGGHISVGGGEWGGDQSYGTPHDSHKGWQGGRGGNGGGNGSGRINYANGELGFGNSGSGEGGGSGGPSGDHPHSHSSGGGGGGGGYSIGDNLSAEPGHGHSHHHRGSGGRGGSGYGAGGGGGAERQSGNSAKGICIVKYWEGV